MSSNLIHLPNSVAMCRCSGPLADEDTKKQAMPEKADKATEDSTESSGGGVMVVLIVAVVLLLVLVGGGALW